MTRVDEDRETQRIDEQRRLEGQQRLKQQESSVQFQKVVAQQQAKAKGAAVQETQHDTAKGQASTQTSKRAASAAMLARRGIDSRHLTTLLEQRGEQSIKQMDDAVVSRHNDLDDKENRRIDRLQMLDSEDQRMEHEVLATISGDDDKERDERDASSRGGDSGANMGKQAETGVAQPTPAATSQAAHGSSPSISPELVRQLIAQAFVGVTPEGLHQFTVELKMDVLGGARLDVVSNNGKVSCTFHTADKNVGRLIKASQGALARVLSESHKGLTLERLEVLTG